ncbi:MAG: hypothetical protein HQL46_06135 [Gammaproteobacteria bacterium]|nr:hypothetical protein [Gammaproteobacteria bacterium]
MNKFKWDSYSDQPSQIKDKQYKLVKRLLALGSYIKMFLLTLIFAPFIYTTLLFAKHPTLPIRKPHFFGLCVNIDREPDLVPALVEELGVNELLIRFPLSDIEQIETHYQFISQFKDKNILINILQDRQHIEDTDKLIHSLRLIFNKFSTITNQFQIGNAVNRFKWGFFSIDEYLKFYQSAYKLQQKEFPSLLLTGSSVIDFEINATIRSLYHAYKMYYHQVAALLYVDRRGYPENKQAGFNLQKKIELIYQAIHYSTKSDAKMVITETNWPLSGTAPYAPAAPDVCVSEEVAANYLVRYYLLALCTGVVNTVYWHQLIAPGYGLIDNRDHKIRKYPSFHSFKTLLTLLQGKSVIEYDFIQDGLHQVTLTDNKDTIQVYWSLAPIEIDFTDAQLLVSESGEQIHNPIQLVSDSIIYAIKPCN